MVTKIDAQPVKGERKGKAKPSKSCPGKAGVKGVHNDASWYTKEGVPVVGANFAALQTVAQELWTGLRTENISHFEVAVVPPVDSEQSFWQKMSEFYTEIRESNAGAANYATGVLADYVLNLNAADALFYDLAKKLQAVAASDPNAQLSAAAKSVAAGIYSYRSMANNFAGRFNDLVLRAKELEAFPIVPLAALECMKYYFGSIFKDSDNGKPAYFTFHAGRVAWFTDIAYNKGTDVVSHTPVFAAFGHSSDTASWQDEMDELVRIIDSMTDNPIITILRGDIRRAFGVASMRTGDLVAHVSKVLPEAVLDAQLMSKMENANLLTPTATANAADYTVAFDPNTGATAVTLGLDGAIDHKLNARANKDQVLINWHKNAAPSDVELCSITRMMSTGDIKNSALSRSIWELASTDGLVLYNIYFVSTASMTTVTYYSYGDTLSQAQGGDADSLRYIMFFQSTMDHAPMSFTTKSNANLSGREYMWDIDNFAVIARSNIETITSRVIRSLFSVHIPRGEHGRIEKQA